MSSKLHKCAAPCCGQKIPAWLLACDIHYRALPGWLRAALGAEWAYCKRFHLAHTQKLLDLRRNASEWLATKFPTNAKKNQTAAEQRAAS